ncbi:MAG: hypothetical protein R3185_07165 [Candidatus Thermoplasmatota archaeon]|nr:hypothetical protein [Candidatus Thermoplasmatota archaeon]
MASTSLIISAGLAATTSALFAYVGLRFAQRPVSSATQRGQRAFVTWWYALAVATFIGATQTLLASLGIRDLGTHVALIHLIFLFICMALWGLLSYLVFVYTGRSGLFLGIAVAYLLYYLAIVYYITLLEPIDLSIGAWRVELIYAHQPEGFVATALGVLLVLPQILGALGYLSLYRHVDSRSQRYRVVVVSTCILVWFSSSLVAQGTGADEATLWPVVSQAIGLVAALGILAGYVPPRPIQRWLDIHGVETGDVIAPHRNGG